MNRQTDRQTGRQIDRWTERQVNIITPSHVEDVF